MFLALLHGNRTNVEVEERGTFYCLECNTERSFERRSWERTTHVFFYPVGGKAGEFVLCLTCGSTFAPECLDESTIADLEGLLVDPPTAAVVMEPGQGRGVGAYSPGRRH